MSAFSPSELKELYRLLKAFDEDLIPYPQEEWELEYHDEHLVNRKKLKALLKKLRESIPKSDAAETDKEILMRRYGGFGGYIDERVYSALEKAFEGQRTASVEYFSPSRGEVTRREIDIYYLSRRYIVAFCHLRGEVRKFRADRFRSAKLTDEGYEISEDFDKKDYL